MRIMSADIAALCAFFLRIMSDEVVSDKRCKMLDNITDEALMPVSYAIMRNKRAGYQKNILYRKLE